MDLRGRGIAWRAVVSQFEQTETLPENTLVSNKVLNYVEGAQPLSNYQADDCALIHDGTNRPLYGVGTIEGGYTALMNRLIKSTND